MNLRNFFVTAFDQLKLLWTNGDVLELGFIKFYVHFMTFIEQEISFNKPYIM